jgi:glycosyltransferase involved in cell wall biosynthesis
MFVFGTIARLIDEKNIQALIRGFALVRIKCPESSLIIVGYGPLLESLRNLAEDLGISKYVYFTGKQINAIDFLSKMDTFVLPSRTEGFGLVLLEAMSMNLPIIASRVDGIPEVLGDNCGLLFDPKDIGELARLMLSTTDPAINLSLRSASAKRIKQFSIAESERKIRVIYTNALKEFKLDH